MQKITVSHMDAGRRLDGYLQKTMPAAGLSFIYKMLRKKNITVNGKKTDGSYRLCEGDVISVFFSDETYGKMRGIGRASGIDEYKEVYRRIGDVSVIYEDDDYIFVDKPAGVLSQKSDISDASMNEWLVGRMLEEGTLDADKIKTFKPAFANRLDRNTSGLLLGGRSLKALQTLSSMLKDRSVHKYYLCLASGKPDEKLPVTGTGFTDIHARIVKDHERNIAQIIPDISPEPDIPGADDIHTGFRLIRAFTDKAGQDLMLLEVLLHTGRSHQIRAQLQALGHPIVQDTKYGGARMTGAGSSEGQLLHAYRVVFPEMPEAGAISGREFMTAIPAFADIDL